MHRCRRLLADDVMGRELALDGADEEHLGVAVGFGDNVNRGLFGVLRQWSFEIRHGALARLTGDGLGLTAHGLEIKLHGDTPCDVSESRCVFHCRHGEQKNKSLSWGQARELCLLRRLF